jgi:hypothetical protein
VDDLYAAYRLADSAEGYRFGRQARRGQHDARRKTRMLFLCVAVRLLKETLMQAKLPHAPHDLTRTLIQLFQASDAGTSSAVTVLLDAAIGIIDQYLLHNEKKSIYKEPTYVNDLITFLKADRLGNDDELSPHLLLHIEVQVGVLEKTGVQQQIVQLVQG